jgi:hypothetical protein
MFSRVVRRVGERSRSATCYESVLDVLEEGQRCRRGRGTVKDAQNLETYCVVVVVAKEIGCVRLSTDVMRCF